MSITYRNVLAGAAGQTTGSDSDAYQIEKSLRFNRPDTPYLEQTCKEGNRRQWTWSGWIKKTDLTNSQTLFSGKVGNGTSVAGSLEVRILSGTQLYISFCESNGTSLQWSAENQAFYRDPSAWQHWVIVLDTPNATANDRFRVYVNGKKVEDWGTRNTVTQNFEYGINKSDASHVIGAHYSGDNITEHFNGYFSDVQFIDGLALGPAAFGEFSSDGSGVWNPKAFALPAPNDGTTWSSGVTSESGSFYSGNDATQLFDGVNGGAGNMVDDASQAKWVKWTPSGGKAFNTSVRIYHGGSANDYTIKLNDGRIFTKRASLNTWTTLYEGKGTIEYIQNDPVGSVYNNWGSIEVDGVTLVDGQTDPTTRNNLNDGRVWSDTGFSVTGGSYYDSNRGPAAMFDGDFASETLAPDGQTITWKPGLTGSKIEVLIKINTGNGTGSVFTNNGTSVKADALAKLGAGNQGWYNVGSSIDSSSGMTWSRVGSQDDAEISAVRVDGHMLLDSSVDNSFHLKFNDTSLNRYLGKDTLNGKIADANGALPIYNTTDDYGDVKGSGNRTDSDSSNLKLAIGNTATDSSSAGLTITFNGNAANSTEQSRFYGSSIKLDGDGDNITTSGSPWSANGNATFECWVYKTTGDSEVLFDTTSQGSLTIMSSGKIELHPVGNNYQESDSTVPQNEWTHIAFTQTSSARKLWINGVESTWGSATGSPQTAAWTGSSNGVRIGSGASHGSFSDLTGYIQDIRIYDKVKYTADFKPPTRNDFTVNNLSTSSTLYSEEVSSSNGISASSTLAKAFDGSSSTFCYTNGSGASLTWDASGFDITVTSSLKIQQFAGGSNATYTIDVNGTEVEEITVPSGNFTPSINVELADTLTKPFKLNELKVTGGTAAFNQIIVDGTVLVDMGPENIDSLTDSPTNYLPDGGDDKDGGVTRGNYCTWNSLTKENTITLKQGNLYAYGSSGWASIKGTHFVNSGKWYFEVNVTKEAYGDSNGNAYQGIGVVKSDYNETPGNPSSRTVGNWLGDNGWYKFGSGSATNGSAMFEAGDVIGVAIDCSAQKVTFYRNDNQVVTNSSLWTAGDFVGPASMTYSDEYGTFHLNTGQRAFKYSAPTDHKCLCAQNFEDTFSGEDAEIVNNPSKFFDVKLFTGTGAAHTVGFNFQPDLIWHKERNNAQWHMLMDSVRGEGSQGLKKIYSNENDAEDSSFYDSSNKVTLDGNGVKFWSNGHVNTSGDDFVLWAWDAGTTSATVNDSGDIDANTVWSNATAGFNIIQWTGNGTADSTLGHNLGEKPEFMIVKRHNADEDWVAYHKGLDTNYVLYLHTGGGQSSEPNVFKAAPTNNLITLGSHGMVNLNGGSYIGYLWTSIPGYSAFGSYEASGTSGKFLHLGFKPALIIFKAVDASGSWNMRDSKRDKTNPNEAHLIAEGNAAETTQEDIDFVSNGVVIRSTDGGYNNSNTFVYMAWAEHPFKTARAM